MEWEPDALVAFFERHIPFNAWLGMEVVDLSSGRCTLRVPFREELVGDPVRPALHGGVLSTLADAAGGLAVFSALEDPVAGRVSTVDLRVDYLRPARLEELLCDAELLRMGNKVAVTRMVVRQAEGHVAADARAVYNVVRGV